MPPKARNITPRVALRAFYLVQVECKGVREQKRLYHELTQRGHKVRVITT